MFFELEFEPDGHRRCVLKQIVAQDWENAFALNRMAWTTSPRKPTTPMTDVLSKNAKDGSG